MSDFLGLQVSWVVVHRTGQGQGYLAAHMLAPLMQVGWFAKTPLPSCLMPARIARASSLAATHTSGSSELVSAACVPDRTYTHRWTSFFGFGALCLGAISSCTLTVFLCLAVAPNLHAHKYMHLRGTSPMHWK